MENKYEVFVNLSPEMKKVYEKHFETEDFEIMESNDTILFVKKTNNGKVNKSHEESIVKLIINMVKRYSHKGIFYMDLTEQINLILKKSEGKNELNLTDNYITWPIRKAITKAISSKNANINPKIIEEEE